MNIASHSYVCSQIYVTIFGTRCKWPKKCLTSKQREVFPPGSVRSFHLKGPDLGDVEKVCIEVCASEQSMHTCTTYAYTCIHSYIHVIHVYLYAFLHIQFATY